MTNYTKKSRASSKKAMTLAQRVIDEIYAGEYHFVADVVKTDKYHPYARVRFAYGTLSKLCRMFGVTRNTIYRISRGLTKAGAAARKHLRGEAMYFDSIVKQYHSGIGFGEHKRGRPKGKKTNKMRKTSTPLVAPRPDIAELAQGILDYRIDIYAMSVQARELAIAKLKLWDITNPEDHYQLMVALQRYKLG